MQSRVVLAGRRSWPAVQEGFWLQEVVGRGVSSAWPHGRGERETCFCQGCCLARCCCWHRDADSETQAASLLSPCMPQPQRRQGLDAHLPALSPCGDDWCGHLFPRAAFLALPGLEKELFAFLDTIQPCCNSPNHCNSIILRCNIWDYCYKVLKDRLF